MTPFNIYMVGFVVLLLGLCLAAYLLGMPPLWIVVGAIIIFALGYVASANG